MRKFIALFAVAALAIVGCTKPAAEGTNTPAGEGLSFTQSEVTLYVGDKVTPELKGLQDGEKVGYESADKAIATVSSKGVITAKAEGTTTVTATSKTDASRKASITVKVEPKPADYVSITGLTVAPSTITVKEGNTADMPTATVAPANATDKDNEITWKSENESIVKIEGGKVKGIAAGTANIVASIKDNKGTEYTGKCAVTVTPANIPTTGITVTPTSKSLNPGGTVKLTVAFTPADHTDNLAVSFESNKTSVATVASDGTVTAVAVGEATITAKAGSFTATCAITVTEAPVATLVADVSKVCFPYTWPEADEYKLDNVTFETWVNMKNLSNHQNIIGIEGVFVIRAAQGKMELVYGTTVKSNEEYEEGKINTSDFALNEWAHLAATYTRNGKAAFYINGEKIGEGDTQNHGIEMNGIKKQSTGMRPGENDTQWGLIPFAFIISNGCDAGRYVHGTMAYTRVWSTARTEAEIKANMNKKNPSGEGLLANWYFNEGSGNTIADHSGKGHNLDAKTYTSDKPKQPVDAEISWVEGTLPAMD